MRDVAIVHPYFKAELLDSVFALGRTQTLYVSSLPSTARFIAFERAFDLNPFVIWSAQHEPVAGVDGEVTLTIPAHQWKSLSARGLVPAGLPRPYQSLWAGFRIQSELGTLSSVVRPRDAQPPVTGETQIEAFITAGSDYDTSSGIRADIGDDSSPEVTAEFTAVDEGLVGGHDHAPRISSQVVRSRQPIVVGEGPAFPSSTISTAAGRMIASLLWVGPYRESRPYDARRATATLYDASGDTLFSFAPGEVTVGRSGRLALAAVLPNPGAYTFEASTSSFAVSGINARGTLRATFDSSEDDANPPMLTSFRTDRDSFSFSAIDRTATSYGDLRRDRTTAHYRMHRSSGWIPLESVVVAEH
ncbi:MAG TPA: hypothetical protein VF057_04160 [Thermoanaerobaculia bacterium]